MHLASPRISSLPILHLVLLLLAHYTTQAQGMNLHYFSYIKEIETILNKPVPSQVSSWDRGGMGQGRAGRCSGQRGSRDLSLPLSLSLHRMT